MCGIFGIIDYTHKPMTSYRYDDTRRLIENLLTSSEIRGNNASGICAIADKSLLLFKDDVKGSMLKNFLPFETIMNSISSGHFFTSLLGHTRLQTKGNEKFNENNHPIIANKVVGVHNGVISNDDHLFEQYENKIDREGEVDSEIIFRLIDMYMKNNENNIIEAVNKTSNEIIGSYVCAFIHLDCPNYLTIFKNYAYPDVSIYFYDSIGIIIFASSDEIIDNATASLKLIQSQQSSGRMKLGNHQGIRINTDNGKTFIFDIETSIFNRHGNLPGRYMSIS